jgi:acyl-CoA synthetase (AMP-forming)/AMP-acid ligase II
LSAPPVQRLGDLVRHHAVRDPDAEALICAGRRITYGELDGLVERCTGAFVAAGIARGERVAMVTRPSWEQVVVFLACARVGARFVGLDPRLRQSEHDAVLRDAEPALHIGADHDFDRLLAAHASAAQIERAGAAVAPSDPVAVVYTSGSTGARKGVLVAGDKMLWAFWAANARLKLTAPVRCLNDLPVDHLGGLVERVLPSLLTGGAVVLHPRFDPRAFLCDAARHRVTYLQGEVTQWLRCIELDKFGTADLSAVEVAAYTGAAAPAGLLEKLLGRFPRLATGYGLTETSGPVTLTDRITPDSPPGLVGQPLPGVELRVVDGIIRVRRAGDEGWLHTGDRGVLLDGSLCLAGRASEMYKSGGHNIHPREVEAVLESHPDVAQAAVISVPDPLFQEVGVAFVAPRPGAPLSAEGLDAFCREHLAGYKAPKAFRLLSELPLLDVGKVDKHELRRLHDAREGA